MATQSVLTQYDLAKLVGVSQPTVQRALSDTGYVRSDLKQRILQVARERGYRANGAARATRRGRFNTVAVLLSMNGETGIVLERLLEGLQYALEDRKLHMLLGRVPDAALARGDELPSIFRDWMADGLLISRSAGLPASGRDRLLHEMRVPCVWINEPHEHNCVYYAEREAATEMVDHLRGLGHERIAYVGPALWPVEAEQSATYQRRERLQGYLDGMSAAGLSPQVLAAPGPVPRAGYVAALRELLRGTDRPTAVISFGRRVAVPLMHAAALEGLRVPDDLSVMTFSAGPCDDLGLMISSMQVDRRAFAEEAVAMLCTRMGDPEAAIPPVVVPFVLNPGETVGPPR